VRIDGFATADELFAELPPCTPQGNRREPICAADDSIATRLFERARRSPRMEWRTRHGQHSPLRSPAARNGRSAVRVGGSGAELPRAVPTSTAIHRDRRAESQHQVPADLGRRRLRDDGRRHADLSVRLRAAVGLADIVKGFGTQPASGSTSTTAQPTNIGDHNLVMASWRGRPRP